MQLKRLGSQMTSPRRAVLGIIINIAIIASGVGTYRWFRSRRSRAQSATNQTLPTANDFRSTPPFTTKEPDRFQATRITTSIEYEGEKPTTTVSRTLIARDGDLRREEYENGSGRAMIYLETSAGRFILSPDRKVYADLNAPETSDRGGTVGPTEADLSPEGLLHETPALARYENLGGEKLNERPTTKYRITARDTNNGSVTLIWIDNALGLPIRSETRSTGDGHPATLTVELVDMKETVASGLFELPKDFRKVEYSRFFGEAMLAPVLPANAGNGSAKP